MVIKPISVASKFSADAMSAYKGYLFESLQSLHDMHMTRVKEKLMLWDKVYRGIPKEDVRSFPWENASNVVVQIVGQHTDTLTARILGSIYELDPLWPIKACGIYDAADHVEQKREALEEFLQLNALDPDELDFYRVEQLWFADTIKYGFKTVKAIHETCTEQQLTGDVDHTIKVFEGPRIENVNYEDFFCNNNYKTIADCPFKAERLYLTKQDLEVRKYTKKFDAAAVDKLLASNPDDQGSTQVQQQNENKIGIQTPGTTQAFSRWHVYECWAKYFLNGKTYSTVNYLHLSTKTYLGGYFNYLPDNKEPYIAARLGYRTSDIFGQGFCELLLHAQEEASAIHNRRNDNATIANTRMFRVSPKAIRFGNNIKLQPLSVLRADKDEIEPLQLGDVYPSTFQEEELLLQEAANRSGTAPAVAGAGAGTINKKGIYSSQGTTALLMDGNRRVNLDTMDMRYAHIKAGKFLLDLYSYFEVPSYKLSAFGKQAQYIKEALADYKSNKLKVSVRAATASVNRELDRQNTVFLTQIFSRHFMSMGQLLQSVLAPQTPQPIKEYLVRVISASDTLMGVLAKSFGLENVDSFVPKPAIITKIEEQQEQQKKMMEQKAQEMAVNNAGQLGYNSDSTLGPEVGVNFGSQQGVSNYGSVPGATEPNEASGTVELASGESTAS